MEIEPNIILNIEQLRRLGINIWLDDFGTGFAGLSWLRLTRFDMVKIDKTFLDQAENDPGASRLLEDIITLIRNRGYRILAEGVENDAQLELLKTYRVDAAQGFHIGYPAALSVISVKTA
jgi:EAL domain-containing protein (putative c-di-GMP-specific phosphodiesterase class I)